MLNNFSNTRFDFGKIACIRYAHMKAPELKVRPGLARPDARLAAAVGITASRLARPERRGRVVSEPMARLVRLIEGGVDVEAFAHKSRSRRDRPAKPTKRSDAADPKSSGRKRARKGSV